MKEFDVTITETLKLTVSVEASSKEEAQQMVSDQWHAGDHILDADNFVEVEFESNDGKEISAERAQDDTLEVLMVEPGQYPRVERIAPTSPPCRRRWTAISKRFTHMTTPWR